MSEDIIRIAHIMGKWVGGGVEAVVMNYYRYIDKSKIQFDFICDEDSTNIPYDEIENMGGKVILIPPYQKVFKYHKELKRVLKKENYKIVHSHLNTLSIFSLYAAKCANIPIRIAHSHSTTNRKEWKKNLIKNILRPFAKMFATDYMCCSEVAGRWLFGNKEYDKGNVYVLNNAIDLDKFKYDKDVRKKLRKKLEIGDDTFVIGHVGRFVAQKNHEFLINIFSEFNKDNKNSMLILIGQGPLEKKIKAKVKQMNLNNKVIFLGQIDNVNELYQVFDVFLFPSLYEGLGMVLIEAQCSGLKCIASKEVPYSSKVTENLKFVDLNDEIKVWKNGLLGTVARKDFCLEIEKAGYNIKKESKKLEKKYYNMYINEEKNN